MIRQVWLNLATGEFSNSWIKDELVSTEELLGHYREFSGNKEYWKLIEYTCLTDESFEFYNQMKLR